MYLLAKCHATGHINSVKMSFNSGTMHTLYIHNMNLKYPVCMKQTGIFKPTVCVGNLTTKPLNCMTIIAIIIFIQRLLERLESH